MITLYCLAVLSTTICCGKPDDVCEGVLDNDAVWLRVCDKLAVKLDVELGDDACEELCEPEPVNEVVCEGDNVWECVCEAVADPVTL